MPDRPAVIIGNPASIFPRHLASLWRSLGLDPVIVTRHWSGERVLPDGTPILASADAESPGQRRAYHALGRLLEAFEGRLQILQKRRYASAMGLETHYKPRASPAIVDALSISRFTRTLRPQLVCGQEVFSYGLAASLCRGCPRLVMPWGGDVYMYAETTSLAFALVKYALRHVDLVVAGSPLAADHLKARFGVPPERLHVGGLWALDRERFRRATPDENQRTRARYGIRPDDLVIMNVRRFFPAWGSDVALEAFVRVAKGRHDAHFVLLGGAGTEALVAAARETLEQEGLSSRFTLFDGDLPLAECAALMSIADICVSLMRETRHAAAGRHPGGRLRRRGSGDRRPAGVSRDGATRVLGDLHRAGRCRLGRRCYRAIRLRRECFAGRPPNATPAIFANTKRQPGDTDSAIAAIRRYAADQSLRCRAAEANATYIREHEDGIAQARALLGRVRSLPQTDSRVPGEDGRG